MAISVLVAVTGILLARRIYGGISGENGAERERALAARWPALYNLLAHKYYVDEIYDRFIVRPLAAFARFLWKVVDSFIIDGTINAGAFVTEIAGDLGRFTTTGNVRNYALYFFVGVIVLFWWIVR
jgi:NADH-quinone oxidoreductase subunit L